MFELTITVAPLTITPASLLGGVVGASYGINGVTQPTAAGGIGPYSWSLLSGTLPPGMTLSNSTPDALTGALSGTPNTAGTYSFTLQATDSSSPPLAATQAFSFGVATLTEYPDPSFGGAQGITTGPDGAMWFTDTNVIATDSEGNTLYGIDRITTTGIFTNPPYSLPEVLSVGGVSVSPQPQWVVSGVDGSLWFTEPLQQYIGQIATNGTVGVQYSLPVLTLAGMPTSLTPQGITSGPDGTIWFTVYGQFGAPYGALARIAATPDHPVSYFPISTNPASYPQGIVTGPDGALWFTDTGLDQNGNPIGYIGRMTNDGTLLPPPGCTGATLECAIPGTSMSSQFSPITVGPDGALWFADTVTNQIGRITADGKTINLYTVPKQNASLLGLSTGSDGALWFTESAYDASVVGRITTAGVITEFPTPTTGSTPQGITSGPDGALWFTELGANQIGRVLPPLALACNLSTSLQVGQIISSSGCPAFGGTGPYSYAITFGTLPPGLSLSPSTGAISGVPSMPGTFRFTIQATDSNLPHQTAAQQFTLTAAPRQPLVLTCSFALGAQVTLPYTATCTTTGGIPPYTYSIASGSLPAGLSLTPTPTGATISGTPTAYGTFSFTIQVNDSGSPVFTATQQAQAFTVLPPPLVLTCSFAGKAEVGIQYFKQCTATGGIPPYKNYMISSGSLPDGLFLDPSSGLITGTPTTAETSSFNLQVNDSGPPVQTATVQAKLMVIRARLGLMCDFTKFGSVGTMYSTSCMTANGASPFTYSISAGALPAGLTLNPSSGVLGGRPSGAGLFSFTIQVSDGESPTQTAIQNVTFNVAPIAPTIITKTLPDGAVQLPYSANPIAQGGTPSYTWSVKTGSIPTGLTLDVKTGAITGTPTTSGEYAFTLEVVDTSLKPQIATQIFSGTITEGVAANFAEYPLPVSSGANGIVSGPDRALWFTTLNHEAGNLIGRITNAGVITTYPAPNPLSNTAVGQGIVTGPDGRLWLTEQSTDRIGQISTDGSVSLDFPVTTTLASPLQIAAGPDGALWFTESGVGQIGQISPAGQILYEYPTPTSASRPAGIVLGPDNALWFTEADANQIGRITTDGKAKQEYVIPSSECKPAAIALGPDGALWFTESASSKVGRISIDGKIVEYDTPTPSSGPETITAGSDGALYFTEVTANQLGRITTGGVVTEYPIPTADSGPQGIVLGPDGAIWFTENNSNKVARFSFATQLSLTCTGFATGSLQVGASFFATCSGGNGTPPYTYSISSGALPLGISLDSATGLISGTLSAPGAYSFTIKVADSGLPPQTATRLAPALTVLPGPLTMTCNFPNGGQVGSDFSASCSATGGTQPYGYSISAGALPGGLSLDTASGTVTGTASTPGTFAFTVQVTDSGAAAQVASQSLTVAIQFGSVTGGGGPLFSLTGLPSSQSAGQNITTAVVQLNQAAPVPVAGTLGLSFVPYSGDAGLPDGYMDPGLQFLDTKGTKLGTSYDFRLPPGVTNLATPGIDPGSVAGSISLTLMANGVTQTTSTVFILPSVPVIESGSVQMVNITANSFDVELVATSTTRELTYANFTFTPAAGGSILGETSFTIDVSSVLANWFSSSAGLEYGGDFSLTVPFQLSGPSSAIGSVSVSLTNSIGTSAPVAGTH